MLGIIEFGKIPTEQQWDKAVKAHKELRPTEAIRVVNPFTKDVSEITSAKRLAEVVKDDDTVGALRWCIDDSGVEVFGESDVMAPLAEQIAKEFGGTYLPD
jgi:hypothetical protein